MVHSVQGVPLAELAPAGYYLAVRVGFAFPLAEYNALPESWVAEYTREGMMLDDPVMRWLYGHAGACRWGALDLPDPRGILARAAAHGMHFGVAVAQVDPGPKGQRSFGSFARADREFTDEEIDKLSLLVGHLHETSATPTNLTEAELEALRMVKEGLLLKEIANQLGVSEGAVKQRLKNARLKLGARNGSQAVSIAVEAGLI